jgi:hypothetical protein
MDGAALPPPRQVGRLAYLLAALVLGAAGSMVALATFATGTYRVGPLVVELAVRPSTTGTTELGITAPVPAFPKGVARRETHEGFLAGRATVVGVALSGADEARALPLVATPRDLARTLREDGKDALRRFAIKVGLLTLAGGAAGGLVVALAGLKLRRVLQGALAGLVLVGALGVWAWRTYDVERFSGAAFRVEAAASAPARRPPQAGPRPRNERAMTIRWTSLVPSPISRALASR